MSSFELVPLDSVKVDELLKVLSDPRISKHLPLFDSNIDIDWVRNWVYSKSTQWQDSRLGPYAVLVESEVVGWAGYQPDGELAELAIVLKPSAWGLGMDVIEAVNGLWIEHGDGRKRVFYLPESRNAELVSTRFGIRLAGKTEVAGHKFNVFEFNDPS